MPDFSKTHPYLGINVQKDNLGYFAKMEAEAKAKYELMEAKAKAKEKKLNLLNFIESAMLVLLVMNPGAWLVYFLLLNFGADDGFVNVFNNMAFFTYPLTLGWVIYFIVKIAMRKNI